MNSKKLSLVTYVFASIFLFSIGCNKTVSKESSPVIIGDEKVDYFAKDASNGALYLYDLGYIHNLILEKVSSNRVVPEPTTDPIYVLDEIFRIVCENDSEYCPNAVKFSNIKDEIYQMMQSKNIFTTKLELEDIRKIMDYTSENGLIGNELYEKIDLLFDYVRDENELNISQTIIDIRNMNLADHKDKEIKRAFLEIFDASSQFWNNYDTGTISYRFGWRDWATIIADAAGGAGGTAIAGPGGGYFLGAYSSIAVGELVDHI